MPPTSKAPILLAALAGAAACVPLSSAALAQDEFQGPSGSNFLAAHDPPFSVTGADIPLAIIEHPTGNLSRGIKPSHHLGQRLGGQWNFHGREPPVYHPPPPAISSSSPCYPPTPIGNTGSSDHATLVADLLAGGPNGPYIGVAPGAIVYAGHIDNTSSYFPGYHSTRAAVDWIYADHAPAVINLSFGYAVANDELRDFCDWFASPESARSTLIVVSAGNDGQLIRTPGDAGNVLTIGATDESMERRADYSAYRLADDPGKPELLAPGSVRSAVIPGTSYAAPQAAGAAALLLEYGLPAIDPNWPLAARAILLNAARKRHITGENAAHDVSLDLASTSSEADDYDYLDGGALRVRAGAPKTADWTPSTWTFAQGQPFRTTEPLDDEQGAGLLDATRALVQMNGSGMSGHRQPGDVPRIGWGLGSASSAQPERDYVIDEAVTEGTFITATLCWNRRVLEQDPGTITTSLCPPSTTPFTVDKADAYQAQSTADLDLQVLRNGTGGLELVASSEASDASVIEHLHIPVPEAGDPGDYVVRVRHAGGEPAKYAVAWWAGEAVSPACYPDCNGDGQLNLADFGCFQTRFALQDPYADCNGDGALNLADFGCFQTGFALGCS